MLKINVGLSRKVSQDFQSKGFSLNIESELLSEIINDQNTLSDSVNNLFAVANQLLDEQIQNDAGNQATIGARRIPASTYGRSPNGHTRQPVRTNGYRQNGSNGHNGHTPTPTNGNAGGERLLTQAQTRAITNMAKKLNQDPDQYTQDLFGVARVGELTIKQASEAIDALKNAIQKVGV
ncbi:MAG: hypothetical protein FWD53_11970 [Phycisphaerales bacterium]|nr:hypothetical protein [Phycisphaerales bacterium]